MRRLTPLLLLGMLVLAGCSSTITNFEECVAAGNPIMESYPPQCAANGINFVEETENKIFSCLQEQRNAEACAEIYEPVCATVNVQCIRAPCPPVNQTFSNSCEACRNPLIEIYAKGECKGGE